jgi:hypothetical protein
MDFLYLAAVVAVLDRTICQEEITKELRSYLQYWKDKARSLLVRKLCYGLTCEFCCSFWLSLLIVSVWQYQLLSDDFRGYILAVFVVMAVANVYMGFYNHIRVDLRKERAVADITERAADGVNDHGICRQGPH